MTMPVSEATARRAVTAWGLARGRLMERQACGCRTWITFSGMRPVFTCEEHRAEVPGECPEIRAHA